MDDPNIPEANRAVDTIVRTLHRFQQGIAINEVIKAGSLGHGTAVPGHYDIDIVIYSSSKLKFSHFTILANNLHRCGSNGGLS